MPVRGEGKRGDVRSLISMSAHGGAEPHWLLRIGSRRGFIGRRDPPLKLMGDVVPADHSIPNRRAETDLLPTSFVTVRAAFATSPVSSLSRKIRAPWGVEVTMMLPAGAVRANEAVADFGKSSACALSFGAVVSPEAVKTSRPK